MALRTIRTEGDSVLTKKCRPVEEMTLRLRELVEDMLDTMYENNGVGLAAPQVGILKELWSLMLEKVRLFLLIRKLQRLPESRQEMRAV